MDKALKQRLVGASVLVVLAVIVLPMLFTGPPESSRQSRSIDLPPRPQDLEFETRRFPIGEQRGADQPSVVEQPPASLPLPDAAPGSAADQESEADQESVVDMESQSAPERDIGEAPDSPTAASAEAAPDVTPAAPNPGLEGPGVVARVDLVSGKPADALTGTADESVDPGNDPDDSAPAASTTVPPEPDAAGSVASGRYLVQVASFGSPANANRLAGQLQAAGMPVLRDTLDSAGGTLQRVRLGPFANRGDADQAVSKLEATWPDLSPRVVDLRPDDAAPVTQPADPLVRWVVQVGSFSDAANAESLVYRLRDAGFRASSVVATDTAGQRWKVWVGPLIQREEATELAARIKREQGLDGLVISTD